MYDAILVQDGSLKVDMPVADFVKQKQKAELGGVRSPKYPSTVTKVFVGAGDTVTKGTILMTVEGMKMEVCWI